MAAGDANRRIRNAPNRIYGVIKAVSTDNPIGAALTTPDAEVSIDGAAFADCTEATDIGTTGYFYNDLTAAECTGSNITFQQKCANAGAVTYVERLEFEPALDSGVAQAGAASTITLRSAGYAVDDYLNNALIEIVRGTGAGQFRCITDYVGATKVASVDRAWATNPDNTSVYLVHPRQGMQTLGSGIPDVNIEQIDGNATAAAILKAIMKAGAITGTVNDAAATTTSFIGDSGLSSTNDFYNDCFVLFLTGTLAGLSRAVTDYVGSTRTFTLATALPSAPANGVEIAILGNAS